MPQRIIAVSLRKQERMCRITNQILESLYQRKSVRVFTDQPIAQPEKDAIIKAAMQAPSAGNQALFTILDITDPLLKEKLSITCDNQPFIAKAVMVLVFLADFRRWYDAFRYSGCDPRKPAEGDLLLAMADACIAAQNSVVAAESLGIGSCYIGDVLEQYEAHRELLCLPDYVFPAVMLVYGYPTEQQKRRKKPERFARPYIVQKNAYRTFSPQEHEAFFQEQAEREGKPSFDYPAFMQAFCKRKYNSDFSREMSRSAALYIQQFQNK